jgi:cobyrinic acid a,c-diamide synthase
MTGAALAGLVISAPRSGAGKTTVALGLMRAFRRRGTAVQPFKCGPDYIDTAFHGVAAGRPSSNLDTWAMRPELIGSLVGSHAGAGCLGLAEGAMGLFDGVAEPGQCGRGSTADVAALLGWPVVLVLDVSGQSETAAAVAQGCARYRDDVDVAGVILNRVGSARHERLIVPAIERTGLKVLGALGRCADLSLAERHLGLVQAAETGALESHLDKLADVLSTAVRLDDIVALARPASSRDLPSALTPSLAPPGQRIALASDVAFSFVYPHIVDGWRRAGAEVSHFSPLADEAPGADCDAVWLPGGYPELYAGQLGAASGFRDGLLAAARRGIPIHGECGGYMVLGRGLEDAEGVRHEMTGLLGVETSFARRKLHLGFRKARLLATSALGPKGATFYGHEFHYASLSQSDDDPFVDTEDASADRVPEQGGRRGSVTGTFFHVIDRAP